LFEIGIGLQVQILRDEVRYLIDADALGEAKLLADTFKHPGDACSPPVEPVLDGGREIWNIRE
jgi:hypothetical protein